MKAAVMHGTRKPLSIEDVPVPQIGPGEVLIETRTSGICGTDLHILEGHGYVPPLPHILGHEPSGVVADVASDVTGFRPGDRVVPHLFITCDECYYCRANRHQQCLHLKGIIGVLSNGAFAEYFKAPAKNLYKIPESVAFDAAGLIADAVITGVHAARRAALRPGDSAVVLGAGGVGQILIQLLHEAQVRVAAVDVSAQKLGLAGQLGADLTLDSHAPDTKEAIRSFSSSGVQCVFNCVGTAASMRQGADFVMRCGRIVVIGEEPEFPQIDTIEIAQQELEIIGSRNGTRQDMEEAIRHIETGTVKPYVAARFPLAEVNAAFDCMRNGTLGRIVVVIKE